MGGFDTYSFQIVNKDLSMNIADTIISYICTQLTTDVRSIGLDCNLFHDGHLDSTAMLELTLWVGDTFNISIQNEDLIPENFASPRNIVEFVQRHRNAEITDVQRGAAASVASD
jgi:acyl carrier protein